MHPHTSTSTSNTSKGGGMRKGDRGMRQEGWEADLPMQTSSLGAQRAVLRELQLAARSG